MSNRLALTVASTHIKIQLVDAAGTAIGFGDTIYIKHHGVKNVSSTDGAYIRINKCGGYGTGEALECEFQIPYADIYSYNGVAGPPSIATILAAIHAACIA
jgi:hypothetical protein